MAAILDAIDDPPQGRARGGHDRHDAPVGREILHVPHHADDDGHEAEAGAVA
ncbi:hypothetical protein GJ744_002342 [Endocarpon pusillum]|uniref:Uncharacterized protein n=1 Tax=Endocarpon pusillum TaxID=364733 RepID=A0A8H7AW24_9EURO|nr:hypothetical protein GJ744_002342 [Endocarpon pusillum]